LLSQLGYSQGTFNNKPFDQARVNKVYEQLLDYFEANGYPFAKIFLDTISIQENKLRATLVINKGAIYYLDSISVKGNIRINKNFLYRYLDMQPHEYF